MKNIVLEQTKQALVNVVDSLSLETLEESQRIINQYFDFLRTLKNLPTLESPEVIEEPIVEVQEEEVQPTEVLYTFERKLRGGIVNGIEPPYFIPEKLIRDMRLEHHDKIRIADTSKHGTLTRYHFEIVEKANVGDPAGRVELSYCVVESRPTSYVISKYANGEIIVDGTPLTLTISPKDAQDFYLRNGDLIDVAYYENNLDSLKVLWKYEIRESDPTPTITKKPATKKVEEPKEDIDLESKFPVNLSLLKGKTIVIVGSMYEKLKYQKAFDAIGMNLVHLTGDETKLRMRAQIKKADIIVVTTQYVGHNGSVPAAMYAKEFDIPLASVDKNGIQYILIEAERVYKRKLEQVTT
jgi:hypothetical protein